MVDGADKTTQITDYRWVIEEDRTFYVDPSVRAIRCRPGCPNGDHLGSTPPSSAPNVPHQLDAARGDRLHGAGILRRRTNQAG